jgi:hypothetical protein
MLSNSIAELEVHLKMACDNVNLSSHSKMTERH